MMKFLMGIVIGIGLLIAIAVSATPDTRQKQATSSPSRVVPGNDLEPNFDCKVSLAQYQALPTRISYSVAVNLLGGCHGTEQSRSEIGNLRTVFFTWRGNSLVSSMTATFQNGELTFKTQYGLR